MSTAIKVLDVLELFLTIKQDELSFHDIVKASALPKSTANRIISILIKQGFLKQRHKRGNYSLGVRLLDFIGNNYIDHKNIGDSAISYLVELSRLIHTSVYIQIWYGSELLLSKALDSSGKIPSDWMKMPLHQTCVGKIALANLTDEDYKKYFKRKGVIKATPKTITDMDEMKAELDEVRLTGVAFENGESIPNISGIAVGIKNSYGETIGAVFLLGDSSRFTHDVLLNLVYSLKLSAEKISHDLGYKS